MTVSLLSDSCEFDWFEQYLAKLSPTIYDQASLHHIMSCILFVTVSDEEKKGTQWLIYQYS